MVSILCVDCRNKNVYTAWARSLWPSDARWRHRSESTLAWVMACCLTTQSHFLTHCWLIIKWIMLHSLKGSFTGNAQEFCSWYVFENWANLILQANLAGTNELTTKLWEWNTSPLIIWLKLYEISFVHNIHFSCPIILKFCTEHDSVTAVLCAKCQTTGLDNYEISYGKTGLHEIWV